MNLSKEQVSNLCLLADFMEGLVDPEFTMKHVFHKGGSPACAFGYALVHPYFKAKGLCDMPSISHPMFGGSDAFWALFHDYSPQTPQQWAAHCRAFLKENGYETKDPFKTFMDRALAPVETQELQNAEEGK